MTTTVDLHEVIVGGGWLFSSCKYARHFVPMVLPSSLGGKSHGVRLEQCAGLVQHAQFHDINSRYQHSAAWNNRDELVTGQALERLTNWGATDAQLGLQGLFLDDIAGGKFKADDLVPDLEVGLLAQRSTHARHHIPIFT